SPSRAPAFRFGLDPGFSCAAHAAWALWLRGYPEQAAARLHDALDRAPSIGHPFSSAHACRFAAAFDVCRREPRGVEEQEAASLAVATEHGFGPILVAGRFHRGWVLVEEGRGAEGIAQMEEWVAFCREIRAECLLPTYLGWLAEAYGVVGRPADGLALVGEAM